MQHFPGDTELMVATRQENVHKVELLLNSGVHVDERGASEMTPLHVAAYQRHSELVKLFLSKGADVSTIDEDKETPLYSAASATALFLPAPYRDRPLLPVVKELLDAGARPDAFSALYMTPANATDDPQVKSLLVEAEASYYEKHPNALPVDALWRELVYDNNEILAIARMNKSLNRHRPSCETPKPKPVEEKQVSENAQKAATDLFEKGVQAKRKRDGVRPPIAHTT